MANEESSPPLRYYGPGDPLGLEQIGEVWQRRELLFRFFQRDLLIRYRQVVVGILWVLLQPLLGAFIFMGLFFVLGTKASGSSAAYPNIVLIGMLCWQLVSNALRDATGSLVNYRHVVTKIYFPRLLLPLAGLMCAAFDFFIGCTLLVPTLYFTGASIQWSTLWICIPIVLWLLVFCVGCIAWLSSLNALYRDVGYALPFALQIGMFLSPVVYDLERVSTSLGPFWQTAYEANPIASCISALRWAILGTQPPSLPGLLLSMLLTAVLFVTGMAWFRIADRQLADRI
ncbi:ABC transporter permease [Pirellulaceae bacterium SH467]